MSVTIDFPSPVFVQSAASGHMFQGVANIGAGRMLVHDLKGRVYQSADSGATWAQISTVPPQGTGVIFDSQMFSPALDEAYLFERGSNAGFTEAGWVHRTVDGGDTWAVVYAHPWAFHGTNFNQAFQWIKVDASTFLLFGQFTDPALPHTAITSNVLKTVDAGASWATTGVLIDPIKLASAGAVLLASGRIVVGMDQPSGAGRPTVFYSDDGAATWTESGQFPDVNMDLVTNLITYLCEVAPDVVIALPGPNMTFDPTLNRTLGVFRSADGAATWAHVPEADVEDSPIANNNVLSGALLTIAPNVAILGYGYDDHANATWPGFRYTEDAGATWLKPTVAFDGGTDDPTAYTISQWALSDDGLVVVGVESAVGGAGNSSRIWRGVVSGIEPPPPPEPVPAFGTSPPIDQAIGPEVSLGLVGTFRP